MRALPYALAQGWSSLLRGRSATLFAVVAIALAVLVLGAVLLVTSNVERVLQQWTAAAEFSVFLRDDATSEQRGAIEAAIDASGVAAGREFVSKAQALGRFRLAFTDLAALSDDLGGNPFPASVEVRVSPAAGDDGRAEAVVRQVASLPGVEDVRYDREWLHRLADGLSAVRGAGAALAILMALAAAATVASVVRLSLHSRRDELEIMQLVGSPLAFIRGPFVAEGLLQGGLGACVAMLVLGAGFVTARSWWAGDLTLLLEGMGLSFLPSSTCAGLVAGGMVVGAIGGLVASRHAV